MSLSRDVCYCMLFLMVVLFLELMKFGSSRPEVFCKKGVLRNFAKFIGKHLCQSLFFNQVAGLRPATLLKKRLWCRCFSVNFAKFLRTPFLTEHIRWLLLEVSEKLQVCSLLNSWCKYIALQFIWTFDI